MIRSRTAFTLIELLIVVVIIGILAAIAIPKFANTKSKAYRTSMVSDLRNLVTAEESFFSDSTHYGTAAELTTARFQSTTGVAVPTVVTSPGAWYATVTHPQLAGVVCGVGYGTTNPVVATAPEGGPVCK
jgi:prepilin-type N-terminal cleavage/methylation domain-containing protein